MPKSPLRRRPGGGPALLWGGLAVIAIVAAGIAAGTVNLGLGTAPDVRIDAPTR